MANYVNSVQQVSITIPAGATTGTASVSAAVDTFFLVYQSGTTTATVSNAEAFTRVSISGTTVTATRGASGVASACTVNCAVVDADATNLIKSVQMGTITTTTATGTATISAVTNANTAIGILGTSQTLTTYHYDLNTMRLSLSGTTLTATNMNGASGTTIVGYVVVEFQGAALNQSVQTFLKSWTNSTGSTTQALTSVVPTNSMVFFAGGGSTNGDTAADEQPTVAITNATTATIKCGNTASGNTQNTAFSVVEFVAGVLSQSAQRGEIALTAATSNTATITSAAVANTLLNMTGWRSTSSVITTHATIVPNVTQTNATTVTANVTAAATTTTVAYEALTFSTGGGVVVTPQTMPWEMAEKPEYNQGAPTAMPFYPVQPTAANNFLPSFPWEMTPGIGRKPIPDHFDNYLPRPTAANNFISSLPWETRSSRTSIFDTIAGSETQVPIPSLYSSFPWEMTPGVARRQGIPDHFDNYVPTQNPVRGLIAPPWEMLPGVARKGGIPDHFDNYVPQPTAANNFMSSLPWEMVPGVGRKTGSPEFFANIAPFILVPSLDTMPWEMLSGVARREGTPEWFQNFIPKIIPNNFIPRPQWEIFPGAARRSGIPDWMENYHPQPTALNQFIPSLPMEMLPGVARRQGIPDFFTQTNPVGFIPYPKTCQPMERVVVTIPPMESVHDCGTFKIVI